MFGSDSEEDEEALAAKAAFKEKAIADAHARAAKKAAKAKSQIVFDIKGWGEETDLEALATKIKSLKIENLNWGEGHQLVPLAFGVCKLQMSCVILDTVLTDDVIEEIEKFEDDVQSVDIFAFNKL